MKARVLMFPGGSPQPEPPKPAVVDHTKRNALVQEHLEMVAPIARNIAKGLPPSFEIDDLIQNGTIGLMEAAQSYDATRGVPFTAYARKRIAGAIHDSTRRRNYREATHDSVDDHSDLADSSLLEYDREADIDQQRRLDAVYDAIDALTDREQTILQMYYAQEQTLGIVGETLKVHSSRASQLHLRALGRLRMVLIPQATAEAA